MKNAGDSKVVRPNAICGNRQWRTFRAAGWRQQSRLIAPWNWCLIALCGCTAYDVVSILQKKREPFTAVEVSAQAEKAAEPPRVFTEIKLRYRVCGKGDAQSG